MDAPQLTAQSACLHFGRTATIGRVRPIRVQSGSAATSKVSHRESEYDYSDGYIGFGVRAGVSPHPVECAVGYFRGAWGRFPHY
jgi:hypothetical protein